MRVEIDAKRAGIRTEVKGVIAVALGSIVESGRVPRDFVQAYDSVFGQMVMAGILVMFAAGAYALLRLAQFPVPERFHLRRIEDVEVGR